MKAADVSTPSPGYERMAKRWPLLDTLLGGTVAMRAAGSTYLPPHRKENQDKYLARLASSVLLPGYQSAIEMAVSRPFAKPVSYSGGPLPLTLAEFWESTDDQGRDMTAVARDLFYWGLHHGHAHLFVDNPPEVGSNLEQQQDLQVRPRAILIKAPDLFGWRFVRTMAGLELDQIRFYEHRVAPVGEYGEEAVRTIKVVQRSREGAPGWWRRFAEIDDQWKQIEEGAFELDRIPLVTWYGKRAGLMASEPPFETVAHLNVQHWQSDSAQHDLLQFARVGVWFAKGWTEKELKAGLTIGAHRFTGSTNPEADLRVVEHSGAAIAAGAASIDVLERRMREAAHDVITRAPSTPMAATTSLLGEQRHESQIGAWVTALNHAIYEVVEFAAAWTGLDLPGNFAPQVFSDFVVGLRGDADVPALHQMRANGDISRQSYYTELQRRGFLSESVTAEEEEERIAAELSSMPRTPPPEPAPEPVPSPDVAAA